MVRPAHLFVLLSTTMYAVLASRHQKKEGAAVHVAQRDVVETSSKDGSQAPAGRLGFSMMLPQTLQHPTLPKLRPPKTAVILPKLRPPHTVLHEVSQKPGPHAMPAPMPWVKPPLMIPPPMPHKSPDTPALMTNEDFWQYLLAGDSRRTGRPEATEWEDLPKSWQNELTFSAHNTLRNLEDYKVKVERQLTRLGSEIKTLQEQNSRYRQGSGGRVWKQTRQDEMARAEELFGAATPMLANLNELLDRLQVVLYEHLQAKAAVRDQISKHSATQKEVFVYEHALANLARQMSFTQTGFVATDAGFAKMQLLEDSLTSVASGEGDLGFDPFLEVVKGAESEQFLDSLMEALKDMDSDDLKEAQSLVSLLEESRARLSTVDADLADTMRVLHDTEVKLEGAVEKGVELLFTLWGF